MTTIEQLPQKIDSNVTIVPPAKIEILYTINKGWYIKIDDEIVQRKFDLEMPQIAPTWETRYWEDAAEPMQYLIKRHLIVTKAYKELDKAVKKVAKSKSN